MLKIIGAVSVVILAAVSGYLAHGLQAGSVDITLHSGGQINASYADMIAIILTVFGIIIAVVSIALAVAAVVGWNSIEGKAMTTASHIISGDLDDTNGKLHKIIKAAVADTSSPLHHTLKRETQRMMYEGVTRAENLQESE